jgi:abhydrolase domain-containing protein 12
MGTGVLSGVAERLLSNPDHTDIKVKGDFAVVLLICGFTDLKSLLLDYRIGGTIPILAPLAKMPGIQKILQNVVVETWESQRRLKSVLQTALGAKDRKLNIQFVHATDDFDIPFNHSVSNYEALLWAGKESSEKFVVGNEGSVGGNARRSASWDDGNVKIGLRVLRLGGE